MFKFFLIFLKKLQSYSLLFLFGLIINNNILNASTELANTVLNQPIGAHSSAVGEAYVTSSNDVFGIHYNPAMQLNDRQVSLLYQTGIIDDKFGAIGFGFPIGSYNLSTTLLYYNAGNIDLVDINNNLINVNSQTDYLWTLSLSKEFIQELSIGGSLKILNSTLLNQFSASTFLFDVGANYTINKQAKIGISAQNFGKGIKYFEATDKLPKIIRVGFSYQFDQFLEPSSDAILFFDVVKISNDNLKNNIGLEYIFKKTFCFRSGYKIGYDLEDLSLGFGLIFKKYSIDYAFIPFGNLGNTHKIGLSAKF